MSEENLEHLRQRVDPERMRELLERLSATTRNELRLPWPASPADCPRAPHRGPQGPNEDLAQCPVCLSISFVMRPAGEEFGGHLDDCSLPRRHESYCKPGGDGHPPAVKVRGFWPDTEPDTLT